MKEDFRHELQPAVLSGLRRREFLVALGGGALGLAVVSILKGCSGSQSEGGSSSSVPPVGSVSNFTIMTNSNDPLLATADTADGRVIELYGERDASGKPTSISQMFIRSDNGDAIRYDLDAVGRPAKMVAVDGTQFLLNWISPTNVAVTVISSDGTTQVNTSVDFTQSSKSSAIGLASLAATAPSSQKEGSVARGGQRITLKYSPSQAGVMQSSKIASAQTSAGISALGAMQVSQVAGAGVCAVQVKSCELPEENADVYVVALENNASRKFLGQFRATKVSAGVYQASIPTDAAPSINPSEICQDLAGMLGNICDVAFTTPGAAEFLCLRISSAVAATGIGSLIAGQLGSACLFVTVGFDLYCNTIGGGPAPGFDTLADRLCNSKALDRTFVFDIILEPRVIGQPNSTVGVSVIAPGQGPYPDLAVDLGSKTTVRSLRLTPPSPGAGVGYVGTADIFCLPAGTTVMLSIVGTDGYQDTTSTSITSAQREGIFTLSVPGAESGIQDTVTLKINRLDGQGFTYTASLVFV